MHALFTAIILWVEATLAAIFFFATLVGSLEESLFSLLSIIAALGVLSLVAAWKLPPALTYKIGVQTALVEGCVLFAFPFVWLLSTSMKYDEEIFVYPPRWIPALPANVEASPYASVESVGTLERPDGVSDSRWNDLVQRAEPALYGAAEPFLDSAENQTWLRGPLSRALFVAGARALPLDLWQRDGDALVAALVKRVDRGAVHDAMTLVYRGVALRALTLRDVSQNSYALENAVDQWTIARGAGTLGEADESGARAWSYAFSEGEVIALQGDFDLPSESDALLGFTLPMRQDRSWHAWRIVLEIEGVRYESRDALYWGKHRWQEVSFKLATLDDRDERELGVWPLYRSDDQSDVADLQGQMRVRIEVERGSRWATIWRKYTDNYYNAYIATEHRWAYVYNSVLLTFLSILGQVLASGLCLRATALAWTRAYFRRAIGHDDVTGTGYDDSGLYDFPRAGLV